MRPIRVNLIRKKNVKGKLILGLTLLFTTMAICITLANVYDYIGNLQVIKEHQSRLKQVKEKSARITDNSRLTDSGLTKEAEEKAAQLQTLLTKHFISVPAVLTEIEKLKPEKVTIEEINYSHSDKGYNIIINGSSDYTEAVQLFIERMNVSPKFLSALVEEKISNYHKIEFKMTATWVNEKTI